MKTITTLFALSLALLTTTSAKADSLRYALGLFESGAESFYRGDSDYKRGTSGEVSRYQIMPDVWKRYSSNRDYHNPAVAWEIAERILSDRVRNFRERAGRDPNATELYLLWNKPGHFSAVKFSLNRVNRHYFARAQRFSNIYTAVEIAYRDRAQVRQVAMAAKLADGEG
jgi:hypothetical protein